MRAARFHEPGEALRIEEVTDPVLEPGAAIVRVLAAFVPPYFAEMIDGTVSYPLPPLPFTPGMDTIGEIVEVADDVSGLEVGQRVFCDHFYNTVNIGDLPQLIQDVYKTLAVVGNASAPPERPQPAVPIKKSVNPDFIVCLEDGKKLKMLKRHLKTAYNMTPEEYRERWGLTPDYPMVAPNYAKHRSNLAKKIGLGTKPKGRRTGVPL